jgi:transaldolase
VTPTLEAGIDEAEAVFERIAAAGVDYDDVTETLEREGVDKFADSFAELLDGIRAKSGEVVAA